MAGLNHERVVVTQDKGLAADWNADHKQKGNHDCEKHQHLNHVIENRTDFPAGPVAGQIIYRTDLKLTYIFDGTNWVLQLPNPIERGGAFPGGVGEGYIFYRTDQHTFYHWNGTRWVSMVGPATVVVAADGSGETTDIQDGIDMLPVGGGSVYVKEGTYTPTVTINMANDNIALIGAGKSTKITGINNSYTLNVSGSNCIINNIYINGPGGALSANRCMRSSGSGNLVSQCFFDSARIGIEVSGAKNVINQNVVEDISGASGIGLACFVGGGQSIVIGNIIDTGVGTCIELNTTRCEIIGNQCLNGYDGIRARGGSAHTIMQGNQCVDNSDHGIWVGFGAESSDGCNVTGNYVSGNDVGIEVKNVGSEDNIIVANYVKGNTTSQIIDGGTGTEIGHNKTI